MAVEVGSRNGELENGLKQRESRGRGTIGWVVERRMVENGFSIPPSGKPHLAGDTHAKQEDGVLYHVYERVNTYTRVCLCPRKHEGESSQCGGEERLHTRECVLQKDWRCAREKEELEVRHGRRAFTVHTYVLLLLRIQRTTHADEARVYLVRSRCTDTRERERAA
ncbi:hypothetical protein ALC57_15660 [Trachymyrmex cornetzi]|uniref:Uncharacterized protein n=1 Tax=Trachymyrmex cornetzi TaxID=471704 RepID=A0A151IWH1_9HYME|nr:hypothetical protein ALC57_15660 [Trachymyrmex cornetzi]